MNYKIIKSAAWLIFILPVAFTACVKDSSTQTYTIFKPVYKTKTAILANVGSHAAKEVRTPGKIYLYGQYIFLNELNKGVHIIDNSNPADPRRVAFIDIPGNIDIAIKQNILYADLYTDMLAIDITDPLKAFVTKKINDVFPERSYGNGFVADSTMYIVDWSRKDTTVSSGMDLMTQNGCFSCGLILSSTTSISSTPGTGIGGSMSRFAVVNGFLYAVNAFSLQAYDISRPADPQKRSEKNTSIAIETIYPFKDKLFLGSSTGMAIFDITDPAMPTYKAMMAHFRSCDPVVANDDYAFVTLRAGTVCGNPVNDDQLEVINIQNLSDPAMVRTYPLSNPYGLGIDGKLLWVCDGKAGLKLFDATNPSSMVQLKTITDVEAHDVIISSVGKMLVTAKQGLLQYDYSDPKNIKLISKLSIAGF